MESKGLKLYERVMVSPELTSMGEPLYGYISDIREFFGYTFYSVAYDAPDQNGIKGVETCNAGMLQFIDARPQ